MNRDELLKMVAQLEAIFQQHGMTSHVRHARLYALALKHGLDVDGKVDVEWDEELVVRWLERLTTSPR